MLVVELSWKREKLRHGKMVVKRSLVSVEEFLFATKKLESIVELFLRKFKRAKMKSFLIDSLELVAFSLLMPTRFLF